MSEEEFDEECRKAVEDLQSGKGVHDEQQFSHGPFPRFLTDNESTEIHGIYRNKPIYIKMI